MGSPGCVNTGSQEQWEMRFAQANHRLFLRLEAGSAPGTAGWGGGEGPGAHSEVGLGDNNDVTLPTVLLCCPEGQRRSSVLRPTKLLAVGRGTV